MRRGRDPFIHIDQAALSVIVTIVVGMVEMPFTVIYMCLICRQRGFLNEKHIEFFSARIVDESLHSGS